MKDAVEKSRILLSPLDGRRYRGVNGVREWQGHLNKEERCLFARGALSVASRRQCFKFRTLIAYSPHLKTQATVLMSTTFTFTCNQKMKLLILALALFSSLVLSAYAGDCKAKCTNMKNELLRDISSSVCKKASSLSPIPQLFKSCIDGRKKGFDQCVSICLDGVHASDSFDGCKATKGNAARANLMQASKVRGRSLRAESTY